MLASIYIIWYSIYEMFYIEILISAMKAIFTLLNILIFFILAIPLGIYFFYADFFLEQEISIQYYILWSILLLEFFSILSLVYIFYSEPIKELKFLIQKFYVWELKWKEVNIQKWYNKDINYIVTFFLKTLWTLRNIRDEFFHGKEIRWEVEIGKEIQWKMLSKKLIDIPSLNVVAKSKAAWEIGGDSYDIIQQWNNYYIYVWDATGHWVGAGFIMIMVNALISGFTKLFTSGSQILAHTNEILKPRVKANLLMSLLLIRWDEEGKKLFMTWAWHEYLMVYKHKKKKCFRIKSGGIALGMIKNIHNLIKEQEIKFEHHDILVLYSDGITEAINQPKKNGNEEKFLEDRLEEAINQAPNIQWEDYKSAKTVFNNITIELSKFMWYKHIQLDDITLTTVEYKSSDYDSEKDIPDEIPKELITEWKW